MLIQVKEEGAPRPLQRRPPPELGTRRHIYKFSILHQHIDNMDPRALPEDQYFFTFHKILKISIQREGQVASRPPRGSSPGELPLPPTPLVPLSDSSPSLIPHNRPRAAGTTPQPRDCKLHPQTRDGWHHPNHLLQLTRPALFNPSFQIIIDSLLHRQTHNRSAQIGIRNTPVSRQGPPGKCLH